MQTYDSIIPGDPTLARLLPKTASEARDTPIARETKRRLTVVRWHETHGEVVSFTARHFGPLHVLPDAHPPASQDELRQLLLAHELCYNTVGPHQALGQLTPQQWLPASRERG